MTQKLSDTFNLPPIEDISLDFDDDNEIEPSSEEVIKQLTEQISNKSATMDMSMKVDAALPMVLGLDAIDKEMDDYATKAIDAFDDIVDLAKNVDDRNAAALLDSASKMLSAAITAKQTKMDKKIKMIELQMRKERLDMDNRKVNHIINKGLPDDGPESIDGRLIGNRSEMLAEIMKNIKDDTAE
tara:strand:- start:39 stop:593 length:555 start_codon:yes stop_codon:yes gene_type:complete